MKDFWISSGHHLLDRGDEGGLHITDEFLKVYLARPELTPPAEACDAERALHAALLADPRKAVSPSEVAAIKDADARENWGVLLAFRELLLAHPTLEAAYIDIEERVGAERLVAVFTRTQGAEGLANLAALFHAIHRDQRVDRMRAE